MESFKEKIKIIILYLNKKFSYHSKPSLIKLKYIGAKSTQRKQPEKGIFMTTQEIRDKLGRNFKRKQISVMGLS